jgi:hypothetical protein
MVDQRVRRVARQVEDRGAGGGDRLADTVDPVPRKVVAGLDHPRKKFLDVSPGGRTGLRPIEHKRCDDTSLFEPPERRSRCIGAR